jgi:hypothetical protein
MMPGNALSSVSLPSTFLPPRNVTRQALVDSHEGGIALNDPSQGLQVQVWTATVDGSSNIVVSAPSVSPTVIVNVPGITWVALAFDQNMRIFLAWMTPTGTFFRWFDTSITAFVVTQLPAGSVLPFCCLDDLRALQSSNSDILLAYVRAQNLYYVQQRDRYGIERLLTNVGIRTFNQMGMNHTNRMQFQF